jgi:hypothetical protein
MEMLDIGHDFFMIKFDLEADREKVISKGPWMIFDHYVAIRPWTTGFVSSQVKINTLQEFVFYWPFFPAAFSPRNSFRRFFDICGGKCPPEKNLGFFFNKKYLRRFM